MKNSLFEEAVEFCAAVTKFWDIYYETGNDTSVTNELLECATKTGLYIKDALYSKTKEEIEKKLYAALKGVGENIFRLEVLKRAKVIRYDYDVMLEMAYNLEKSVSSSLDAVRTYGKTGDAGQDEK